MNKQELIGALAKRLDVMGASRLTGHDPKSNIIFVVLEQLFADVAADEAAAAEHGHELGLSHCAATSGWRAALTTR